MTPKEFDTQIALGTIKWYTAKQIEDYTMSSDDYPHDSVDKIACETRSPKLIDHILDVCPKRPTLFEEVLNCLTCNPVFNLDHALKIVTTSHLWQACQNDAPDQMIVDAIRKGTLKVEKVKCPKKKH